MSRNLESSQMSWQSLLDNVLMREMEGNHLISAAILGENGDIWAKNSTFPQMSPYELTIIMRELDEWELPTPSSMYIGNTKYMIIKGEAGTVIRGKKGRAGITVKRTNHALVIGTYDEPMTPGQCSLIVESLGEFLESQGL